MTVTLSDTQAILVSRCGGLLVTVGMSTEFLLPNPDLADPIGYALRRLGYEAPLAAVSDENLAPVDAIDVNPLLDLSELRLLHTWLAKYALVDIRVGDRDEKLSQLAERIRRRAKQLEDAIKENYKLDEVTTGATTLSFAEHYKLGDEE